MIKNYLDRLIGIQDDRFRFQKEREKNSYANKMNKQESKYHAYIIDQMNDKNKIIATTQLVNILQQNILHTSNSAFKQLSHSNPNHTTKSSRKTQEKSSYELQQSPSVLKHSTQQTFTIDNILMKLSLNSIARAYQKSQQYALKQGFFIIKSHVKDQKILIKVTKNLDKYFYRHAFHELKQIANKRQCQLKTEEKFFDQSFSVIYKTPRNREQKSPHKLEESYMSFILQKQKQNLNHECDSCKEAAKVAATQKDQISYLKQELSFIKILLSDKALQLKKKLEQFDKIKNQIELRQVRNKQISSSEEYSECYSKNSSYYNDLERHVLGGERIRKNGQKASEPNTSMNKSQISKQLLGKYMRESFQLRENMDIAREICCKLQQTLQGDDKRKVLKVIKILNSTMDVSLVDEV